MLGGACNATSGLPWVNCDGQVCVEGRGGWPEGVRVGKKGRESGAERCAQHHFLGQQDGREAARRGWKRGGAASREVSDGGSVGSGGTGRSGAPGLTVGEAPTWPVHSRPFSLPCRPFLTPLVWTSLLIHFCCAEDFESPPAALFITFLEVVRLSSGDRVRGVQRVPAYI